MPTVFRADMAEGINAIVQLIVTGPEAGNWFLTIKDRTFGVQQGTAETPNLTITGESTTWLQIMRGELRAEQAFLGGKLKFAGDVGLLLKLATLFSRDPDVSLA